MSLGTAGRLRGAGMWSTYPTPKSRTVLKQGSEVWGRSSLRGRLIFAAAPEEIRSNNLLAFTFAGAIGLGWPCSKDLMLLY